MQKLRDRRVVNLTDLGRRLQRFFRRDEILGAILDQADCGWQDGGCYTLAVAVKRWLGDRGELYVATRTCTSGVDHVVVRCGETFIDSDGVASEAQMLRKMRYFGDLPGNENWIMAPLDHLPAGHRNEIPLFENIAEELTNKLRETFGSGEFFSIAT